MSTLESAIVIDDDEDDDDDDEVKVVEANEGVDNDLMRTKNLTTDSELILSSLHQVCTILCVPESVARQALNVCGYDVERTIHHLLSVPSAQSSKSLTVASTTTTSKCNNNNNNENPALHSESIKASSLEGMEVAMKNYNAVTVVDPKQQEGDAIATSTQLLSREWHAFYQTCNDFLFVDADFPPSDCSLDGRERDVTSNFDAASTSTTNTVAIKNCACGLPAAARTVQSEGPNYGRFYLACGKRQQQGRCQFFQWDPKGTMGAAAVEQEGYGSILRRRGRRVEWTRFDSTNGCVMVKNNKKIDAHHSSSSSSAAAFSPSHVRQGCVGNCWFLSALAVVAERPDLIQRIVPQVDLNPKGCYQINLCLDGKWTPVIVDSYLPVIVVDEEAIVEGRVMASGVSKKRKHRDNKALQDGVPFVSTSASAVVPSSLSVPSSPLAPTASSKTSSVVYTAFAATPSRQLWPALVEKAYAKAHGSYAHLSGGWIAEALQDLTGAPTETIPLDASSSSDSKDLLWARLLSFVQAGFLMGVATAQGGDGLVGRHAYSILDVVEINDKLVGKQCKVTEFFSKRETKKCAKGEDNGHNADSATTQASTITNRTARASERTTIRLVRIRNPWGMREWKGAWSADAVQWTNALRKQFKESWDKGDGTFFMSFEDLLERFHHLDVAKARKGWVFESADGLFLPSGHSDALGSSKSAYLLRPSQRTWAFISVIQPKKRANTTSRYFYCDPSFLLLKGKNGEAEWTCEAAIFCGVQRTSTCEVFLDPAFSYVCIPFSALAACSGGTFGFRLTCYSAFAVSIEHKGDYCDYLETAVEIIHKKLLQKNHKLLYPVANQAMLTCIHCDGCIYFIAINGATDSYLTLKLVITDGDGMLSLLGCCDDTHDIPPRSQRVLVIISRSGKFTTSTHVKFRYMSAIVPISSAAPNVSDERHDNRQKLQRVGIASTIPISFAGDSLASDIAVSQKREKGSDTVDTYLWIPQLGAM